MGLSVKQKRDNVAQVKELYLGCIYALIVKKTREIRYIGQTVNDPEFRFKDHLRFAKSKPKTHKDFWINSLCHKNIEMVVLYKAKPEDDLNKIEELFISEFREAGCRLTNSQGGGPNTYKLSASDKLEVVSFYKTGKVYLNQLAEMFGVSRETISRVIEANGIKKISRWPTKFFPEKELEIIKFYDPQNGIGIRQVSDKFEIDPGFVSKLLKRNNIKVLPPKKKFSMVHQEIAEELYLNGESLSSVAKFLNVSRETVRKNLSQNDIKIRKKALPSIESEFVNKNRHLFFKGRFLTDYAKKFILKEHKRNVSQQQIAQTLGIERKTVYCIIKSAFPNNHNET